MSVELVAAGFRVVELAGPVELVAAELVAAELVAVELVAVELAVELVAELAVDLVAELLAVVHYYKPAAEVEVAHFAARQELRNYCTAVARIGYYCSFAAAAVAHCTD